MENKAWLDDKERLKKVDISDMLGKVEKFPEMFEQAFEIGRDLDVSSLKNIDSVIVYGMGGSAVGGDFMRCYACETASVPITVIRGYTSPAFVGPKTLAIISSYSGNTEETLSCYSQAIEQGAKIVCITSGGKVAEIAKKHGHLLIEIPGGLPPRSALAYSFCPMLRLFENIGLVPIQQDIVQETVKVLQNCVDKYNRDVATSDNEAKLLAWKFFERLPVVYSAAPEFEVLSVRWKGQLAENGKVLAISHVLPEMNHNEIVGWTTCLEPLTQQMEVVLLRDKNEHPKISKRFEATGQIIKNCAAGINEFYTEGKSLLARTFSLVSLGDFVSVYIAVLNHEDPTPVKNIDFLKNHIK